MTSASRLGTLNDEPVATETVKACPNCGSHGAAFWVYGRDRLLGTTDQTFEYSKCHHCDVAFQSRRPFEDSIERFYSKGYGPHEVRSPPRQTGIVRRSLNRASKATTNWVIDRAGFQAEMDAFYAQLSKQLTLLDFGCGSGKFLDYAKRLGCETVGMDFSSTALAEVARRGHRALAVSDADWNRIPDGSIELTRMNHVVEHLYDPSNVMRRLYTKMAPGAALHIATPNAACRTAETYGEHWFSLDCPRHIVIFTPQSLRALAERVGFADIRILHEPLTKDMARSFIYREIDAGRLPPQQVALRADDGVLNIRFALACRSAARQQRSDRIHLLARKPKANAI